MSKKLEENLINISQKRGQFPHLGPSRAVRAEGEKPRKAQMSEITPEGREKASPAGCLGVRAPDGTSLAAESHVTPARGAAAVERRGGAIPGPHSAYHHFCLGTCAARGAEANMGSPSTTARAV